MARKNTVKPGTHVSIKAIDALLPQSQCRLCGYPRCRDYAKAIACADAGINRCPPGGKTTLTGLAGLMRCAPKELDPKCGTHGPRQFALIDEVRCIGCALCIQACPVDAIIGRHKRMHTIFRQSCTGCKLCLPPCPVDCIILKTLPDTGSRPRSPWPAFSLDEIRQARRHTVQRLRRLARHERSYKSRQLNRKKISGNAALNEQQHIRTEIAAAVERVRKRKSQT